jgi:hypothetical protein
MSESHTTGRLTKEPPWWPTLLAHERGSLGRAEIQSRLPPKMPSSISKLLNTL